MTGKERKERTGVECAERLIAWVVFESDSDIRAGELMEIVRKVFGTEIYELVKRRAKDGLLLTSTGGE